MWVMMWETHNMQEAKHVVRAENWKVELCIQLQGQPSNTEQKQIKRIYSASSDNPAWHFEFEKQQKKSVQNTNKISVLVVDLVT